LQAALAVIEHSYPGFEKSRQLLLWPSLPVQDHVSASLQLVALATSLQHPADTLREKADSRIIGFPALLRQLYSKCVRDPLKKQNHKSWWELIVGLCKTAQEKEKCWPDIHDVTIQQVAESWESPRLARQPF